MALESLEHCSIRTAKLKETCEFFVNILGLKIGYRPDLPFPGEHLYLENKAVIHLIGVDENDTSGLLEALGGVTDSDKLEGSGAFDHIAFRAKDYKKILTILEENKISYFKRTVPGMNLFQIFVKDPNGITIELNYFK